MRAVVALVALAGCFSKPPRPSGNTGDGGADDDAKLDRGPRVVFQQAASRVQGSSLTNQATVPDALDRYLVVTLQIGASCDVAAPSPILAQAEDENGTVHPLTSIATVLGTPCGETSRSELLELRAPPAGLLEITVALDGIADSLHSAAIVFAGIDQVTPTRESSTAEGEGAFTSVVVAAEAGDLVLTTLGHGAAIETAGPLQEEVFRLNRGNETTLNNSAASTAPGAAILTMTFEAIGVDQWQSIAIPLRPSGT
jgi:hypothetical protein